MRTLNLIFLLLLVVALPSSIFGQKKTVQSGYEFSSETKEFSIIFPSKPKISQAKISDATSKGAQLILGNSIYQTQIVPLSSEQASNILRFDEDRLKANFSQTGFATESKIESLEAGADQFGKFIKFRGKKYFGTVLFSYQAKLIYGRREMIVIIGGGDAKSYNRKAVDKFFASLKMNPPFGTPKAVNINVKDSKITINNETFDLPVSKELLFRLLGNPTRTSDLQNTIHTWDQAGIVAYQRPQSNKIHQISVVIDINSMNYLFWSKHPFSGIFNFEGTVITSNSTLDAINQNREENLCKPLEGLEFITECSSKDLKISLGRAKSLEYDKDGNIVEISLAKMED